MSRRKRFRFEVFRPDDLDNRITGGLLAYTPEEAADKALDRVALVGEGDMVKISRKGGYWYLYQVIRSLDGASLIPERLRSDYAPDRGDWPVQPNLTRRFD
jgi:hypothetical protein